MIIVTGANGKLGRAIVENLLELVPTEQIGISVRDPAKAKDFADRGVRVRYGDFTAATSLDDALEGATQVLIVSVDTLGEQGVAQSKTAIDAAYRAGAHRVLYTSHQAAAPDSSFPPARDHAAVEAYLEACGRPFTSLRHGYYTTSLQFHIRDAARTGEIVAPADGPVSWTAPADLAKADAAILASEGRFDGPTPPLTAAEAINLQDVAAVLSEVLGHTVRRVVVDDEDWIASQVKRGMPESVARLFIGTYHASRSGVFAVTDPTLGMLIGQKPQSVRAFFQATMTK